ncbi:nucleobindin-2-like isoform X3 [Lytechinus variegatus]|uniref:nucleobindin-2-like isoform X3 n=1 Tax=Lytechinus variegatus TaxID=7654 RepID=UPI001BB0E445|nr:nucleobindin-2-like isoform X3 [Lytechinus variegatus]
MALLEWKLSLLLLLIVHVAQQAPLDPKSPDEEKAEKLGEEIINKAEGDGLADLGLEYEGYLREVIQVLEADPEMKSHMDEMDTNDLLSGKFGKQLNNVGSHIRSQLDELKKKEIQRLRVIARKAMEQQAPEVSQTDLLQMIAHVDFRNEHTFEEEDLNNLLQKATKDLEENDRERRKEFKRYEMEKELKRRNEMKMMNEEERAEARRKYEEERKQMKQHAKLNHPGSKKQLEEVWENTDHLDRKDFNPKTFFFLHDSNSDGFLDEFELEALFIKEVEKIYQGKKNADVQEKFEELSRMREHVVKQIDGNKDKMVSLDEFMEAAAASDFDEEEEWQDLNQESQFTEEDLEKYQDELRRTLEETKAKMAEAGDNFVRVRQPPGQDTVQMNQAQAHQVQDGLAQGDNKIRFEGGSQQVRHDPPGSIPLSNQQPAQPPQIRHATHRLSNHQQHRMASNSNNRISPHHQCNSNNQCVAILYHSTTSIIRCIFFYSAIYLW